MTIELRIENVGVYHKPMSLKLKKGLNIVRASNGTGKTSLTRAIELLALPQDKLKGKSHYSNLYAGSEEEIKVSLFGDINFERRFRRVGGSLNDLGYPPLGSRGGTDVLDVCFAVPGNTLLESFEAGRSVRGYVEILAGSEKYDSVTAIIRDFIRETNSKVQHFRDLMIRLDEMKAQKEENDARLKSLREEFVKMPILDESEIFDDIGKFNRKKESLNVETEKISQTKIKLRELADTIASLKEEIKRHEDQIRLIRTRTPKIDSRLSELAKIIPEHEAEYDIIRREKAKEEEKLSTAKRNELDISKFGANFCFACGQKLTPLELSVWIDKIKSAISDYGKAEIEKRRGLEDLKRERDELKTNKTELGTREEELKRKQKSLASRESDRRKFEESLKEFSDTQDKLMKEIQELSKSSDSYDEFKQRESVRQEIEQKSSESERYEQRIIDLKEKTSGAEELSRKAQFLDEIRIYLESRKNQIVEEVRMKFNENVTDLYRKLGFRDFGDIEIRPDFHVLVSRMKDGQYIPDFPLEALSTSERITIGIAFLLAAKREYVADFPFFILDELVTSYDPKRFEIVKEYLKKENDFVLLTELASDVNDVEIVIEEVA